MDVGLQQPKTSQFPWVSHPDAVPVEIWETPPAVRRRRGVSHIPTGCRIQLGFYSFNCDKGGIAFTMACQPLGELVQFISTMAIRTDGRYRPLQCRKMVLALSCFAGKRRRDDT